MYRAGSFVAEYVAPTTPAQVQPNGVDLTLDAVFEQREPGRIDRDGKEIGTRQALEPDQLTEVDVEGDADIDADSDDGDATENGADEAGTYYLEPGAYIVRYGERLKIPEGHVGFVFPRSSLMRNSCMLNTAVWDAGYEGRGEGLLQVHHDVELVEGARIAQIVYAEAEHDGEYDGSYQGENL